MIALELTINDSNPDCIDYVVHFCQYRPALHTDWAATLLKWGDDNGIGYSANAWARLVEFESKSDAMICYLAFAE